MLLTIEAFFLIRRYFPAYNTIVLYYAEYNVDVLYTTEIKKRIYIGLSAPQ
jgi:hypothetical protein